MLRRRTKSLLFEATGQLVPLNLQAGRLVTPSVLLLFKAQSFGY